MAILQTLNPFSNRHKERKAGPQNRPPGAVGFFDEMAEIAGEFIRTPGQLAADGGQFLPKGIEGIGKAIGSTGNEVIKETITAVKFEVNGSLTGFKEGKAKTVESIEVEEQVIAFRHKTEYIRNTKEDLGKVAMETSLAESLKAKLEEVNRIFGVSVAYKGTLDKYGNERVDVKNYNERKKASLMNPNEIKTGKDSAIALATGAVNPVDLNGNMEGGTATGSFNITATGGGAG